jgi:hypothetical protein
MNGIEDFRALIVTCFAAPMEALGRATCSARSRADGSCRRRARWTSEGLAAEALR